MFGCMSTFAQLPSAISITETKEDAELPSPVTAVDTVMSGLFSMVASASMLAESPATSPTMPSLESESPPMPPPAAIAMLAPTPIRPRLQMHALCSGPQFAPATTLCTWSPHFTPATLHALAAHVTGHMARFCDTSVLTALHVAAALSWRIAPVLQAEDPGASISTRAVACTLMYLALGALGPTERVAFVRMFKRQATDTTWPLAAVDIPSQHAFSVLETYCWRACGRAFPRGPSAASFTQPMTTETFCRIVFAMCSSDRS